MKNNDFDSVMFESWFKNYKTVNWDERISQESKLSGSNIISRYFNIVDDEKPKKTIKMKLRKIERIEKIKALKRITTMSTDETDSMAIEEPLSFFIYNNELINAQSQIEKINESNLIQRIQFN